MLEMMFTVVALVYLIVADAPPDEPLLFTSKRSFVEIEKCQEYLKSPAFAQDRQTLGMNLARALAVKALADEDDTRSPPTIAITASCREDNRI